MLEHETYNVALGIPDGGCQQEDVELQRRRTRLDCARLRIVQGSGKRPVLYQNNRHTAVTTDKACVVVCLIQRVTKLSAAVFDH